jgi:hypothetical protein
MKRVFLIHGWDGSPEEPMHKWIRKTLSAKGFEVIFPKMPVPGKPKIEPWIEKIKQVVGKLDKNDIFIGHSIGCQAILRYIETLDKSEGKIKKIILIAPWMHLDKTTIEEEGEESINISKPWMETSINFDKIKVRCKKVIAIFSTNDPYVPLSNINLFKKNLNAEIFILKDRGHFDPYHNINKLPELLKFIK